MNEAVASPVVETFTTRKSVLEPETVWRLTADALVREQIGPPPSSFWASALRIGWRILFPWAKPLGSDRWPERVPYDQITSIRLRFDPTRVDRVRERCDLVGLNRQEVSLISTRYITFGDFRDETTTFRPFMDQLTRRVLATRPETPVYSGLKCSSYILQHAVLLIALLAFAGALGLAGVPALGTVWAKALIALSYVGVLFAYARRNWPRKLNPTDSVANIRQGSQ